ncbi:NAC domain-containing protein 2-like [Fagus crenata]
MYIPSGYRFRPYHDELIDHYLYNKVYGKYIPSDVVLECDIYNDEDLWSKFFKKTRETQLYFFTKLKKKTGKGSRIQRTTAYGTWKEQKDEPIYRDPKKKYHIGSVRTFSFFPKKPNNGQRWVMHEYRLDGCLLSNTQQHPDYVICQIDYKGARLKKQQQQDPDCLDPFVVEHQPEEANCIQPFIVEQQEEQHDHIEQLLVEQQHEQQYVVEHQAEEGNCLEHHVVQHQAEQEQQKVDGIMTEPVTDFYLDGIMTDPVTDFYFDIDNIDIDLPEANDVLFAEETDTFLSQLNAVPLFMSWPV